MLHARIERLQINARRTANEIAERRTVLDWLSNLKREHDATMASQAAHQADLTLPALEPTFEVPGYRPQTTTCASKPMTPLGSGDALFSNMARSSSAPGNRRPLMPMPKRESMHERVNNATLGAQRNAKELADRRQVLDGFKAMKGETQSKANTFSLRDGASPSAVFQSSSMRSTLSHSSCSNYAEKFSLQPFASAVQEVAPPMALKSGSMRTRSEACEHRALWNHQAMTHHHLMIEEKKAEKAERAKADLRSTPYESIFS
jgi:hypothetical protein